MSSNEKQTPKTLEEIREIINLVEYKDWKFHLDDISDNKLIGEESGKKQYYLQVRFLEKDAYEQIIEVQHGRKWLLSPWMTKSELIQTAFKAVLTAVEHEVREAFKYKGELIFWPHFDVDDLLLLASQGRLDKRMGIKK